MSNTIETYEGNAAVTRTVCITWSTKEGLYKYYPLENEKVKLRIFDEEGNTLIEKEAEFEDEEVLVTFPENLPPGDYDYEITIQLEENEKPTTILSSKIHVGRR